jgi:hypothetical protein
MFTDLNCRENLTAIALTNEKKNPMRMNIYAFKSVKNV